MQQPHEHSLTVRSALWVPPADYRVDVEVRRRIAKDWRSAAVRAARRERIHSPHVQPFPTYYKVAVTATATLPRGPVRGDVAATVDAVVAGLVEARVVEAATPTYLDMRPVRTRGGPREAKPAVGPDLTGLVEQPAPLTEGGAPDR